MAAGWMPQIERDYPVLWFSNQSQIRLRPTRGYGAALGQNVFRNAGRPRKNPTNASLAEVCGEYKQMKQFLLERRFMPAGVG
jgi:hypothetical protein